MVREGRREGGKHQCMKDTLTGCFSHTPSQRPGPQPRHVPWLGIEPTTLCFSGQHSIHWATSARAVCFVWHNRVELLDFSVQINENNACCPSSSRKTFPLLSVWPFSTQFLRTSPSDISFMKFFSESSLLLPPSLLNPCLKYPYSQSPFLFGFPTLSTKYITECLLPTRHCARCWGHSSE